MVEPVWEGAISSSSEEASEGEREPLDGVSIYLETNDYQPRDFDGVGRLGVEKGRVKEEAGKEGRKRGKEGRKGERMDGRGEGRR